MTILSKTIFDIWLSNSIIPHKLIRDHYCRDIIVNAEIVTAT